MGFEPLVKEIVHRTFFTGTSNIGSELRERREGQGLILASATAREDIREYAGVELRNALFLNPSNKIRDEKEARNSLHTNNTLTTTIHNRVKHYFVCIPTRQRLDALINLLRREGVNGGKVIVFLLVVMQWTISMYSFH